MKRNSSPVLPSLPDCLPTTAKTRNETEGVVAWSRRSVLFAAGLFCLAPRFVLGGVFQCGPKLRISVLASLTGPYAGVQSKYFEGVREAVDASNAQGCRVTLVVYDANPSPSSLLKAAVISEKRDDASVIIAPFGPAAGGLVAQEVRSALLFDIMGTSPVGDQPFNLVTLPYAIFFTADPARRDESLRTVGRVAAGIVLQTIQSSAPGTISSPSGMIDAMARRTFSSPKGTLALNRTSGAFELTR